MKLIDYAKGKKQTSFKFGSSEIKVSELTGEKIAVLHLLEPIPSVTGSQYVGEGEDRERMVEEDVDTVSVYQRDMADEGIDINPDGSGFVDSDLQLDISNAGDVWLTSESFRAFAAKKRTERTTERKSGQYNRMQERKARKALKEKETGSDTTKVDPKLNPTPTVGAEVKDTKAETKPVIVTGTKS